MELADFEETHCRAGGVQGCGRWTSLRWGRDDVLLNVKLRLAEAEREQLVGELDFNVLEAMGTNGV